MGEVFCRVGRIQRAPVNGNQAQSPANTPGWNLLYEKNCGIYTVVF